MHGLFWRWICYCLVWSSAMDSFCVVCLWIDRVLCGWVELLAKADICKLFKINRDYNANQCNGWLGKSKLSKNFKLDESTMLWALLWWRVYCLIVHSTLPTQLGLGCYIQFQLLYFTNLLLTNYRRFYLNEFNLSLLLILLLLTLLWSICILII